jgi:hypothetical protein
MATIDPNIALGVKPIQIENPMNQYAALSQIQAGQNQNALAQYQLASAKRGDEKVNFLNQSIANNTDPNTGKINYSNVYKDAAQNNFGSVIPELVKQQQAEQAATIKAKKDTSDLIGQKLLSVQKLYGEINPKDPNASARYIAIHDKVHKDEDLGPYLKSLGVNQEQSRKSIDDALKTPGAFEKLLVQTQLGAKDSYDFYEKVRNHLKTEDISQQQANTSAFNATTQAKSVANAANPELQGAIAGAKKRAEENVKFETQGKVDVIANRKALQQAGYDPTTGKDDITDLIKKSTGSYLGKAYDIGNRLYGGSNEGSQALAELEQKGNAITFGILNGKLGAGISTSDRQFIESLVSRMSDGTLPVDDRLAAWNSAKNMMKTLGMVDEPKSSTSAKPNAASTPTTVKSKAGATTNIAPPSGFVPD